MSNEKKTLVVFGATGYQGGSVAKHFLSLPTSPYHIRAITRDPTAPKARALSSAGASVVQADLDDEKSLKPALEGAHAVFLVTDFWSTLPNIEKEREQAKSVVDILSQSPILEHLIWSSLPSISRASNGKYNNVFHFDGKTEVDEYIEKRHPELWSKSTVLQIAPYFQAWQQFRHLFAPKKMVVDGKDIWVQSGTTTEHTKLPQVDVSDTGKVVATILKKGKELAGKIVSMLGDQHSLIDNLRVWGERVGKDVAFQQVSEAQSLEYLTSLGMPDFLIKDLGELPLAFMEFEGLFSGEGVVMANEILPHDQKLSSWEDYVKSQDWEEFLQG